MGVVVWVIEWVLVPEEECRSWLGELESGVVGWSWVRLILARCTMYWRRRAAEAAGVQGAVCWSCGMESGARVANGTLGEED
jgi:hypothetical protein